MHASVNTSHFEYQSKHCCMPLSCPELRFQLRSQPGNQAHKAQSDTASEQGESDTMPLSFQCTAMAMMTAEVRQVGNQFGIGPTTLDPHLCSVKETASSQVASTQVAILHPTSMAICLVKLEISHHTLQCHSYLIPRALVQRRRPTLALK